MKKVKESTKRNDNKMDKLEENNKEYKKKTFDIVENQIQESDKKMKKK